MAQRHYIPLSDGFGIFNWIKRKMSANRSNWWRIKLKF